MDIYREEDLQAITDSLDQIVDEATNIKNTVLEPTLDEYHQAILIVKDFIKKKKRIVYGGNAYNTLINEKDPNDNIYKLNDRKDIEFYTPEPIQDIVEICNIFHEKNFPWTSGREANHDETYTIFVNFEGICDMSYMPKNVYGNMPVIKIDGILYTHPMWSLVDIFRQYNDPVLSYWRLKDKVFFRANVLLKHYPLYLDNKSSFDKDVSHLNLKQNLFNLIAEMTSLIHIGTVAINYYLNLTSNIDYSLMQVFSCNFRDDIKTINNHIKEVLGEDYRKIEINFYKPFFQFWDERVEFIYDGTCLITVFGNNGICLPYNNIYIKENKINRIQTGGFYKQIKGGNADETTLKLGTFILLFNHILINRHYEYINRSDNYKKYENLLSQLLIKRRAYLKKKHITVMDNSPYREFVIKCNGVTIDSGRQHRINMMNKRKLKKPMNFTYDPSGQKENYKPPEFVFKNTSGNICKNDMSKIFE